MYVAPPCRTQAAAGEPAVLALVYVAAFAPEIGETALALSNRFPGSTLGDAVVPRALTAGGGELSIDPAQVPAAARGGGRPGPGRADGRHPERPITEARSTRSLTGDEAAWRRLRQLVRHGGSADRNIPAEALRWMGERAGARELTEIRGAGHALPVTQPGPVAESSCRPSPSRAPDPASLAPPHHSHHDTTTALIERAARETA